jgi:metal-responsive CopG/Arc/MetJ family transcriptional regulator
MSRDETEKVPLSIRLPRSLTTRLDDYAAGKGISRNAAISVLLDRVLSSEELGR